MEDLSSRNKDMQQIPTWSKKKSTNSGIKISIPKLHCGIQNGFEKMKELIKERINQHMLEKSSDSRNHQLENRNDRNQRKIMTGMKWKEYNWRDSHIYDQYRNENRDSRQSKNEQGKYYSRNKSSSDHYNR